MSKKPCPEWVEVPLWYALVAWLWLFLSAAAILLALLDATLTAAIVWLLVVVVPGAIAACLLSRHLHRHCF